MPVPATTEVATTSTPGWSSATVRRPRSASVARSALASTIAGVGAGVPGERDHPVEPPGLDGAVEAAHHQHRVDVGRQVLGRVGVGRAPGEQRRAGQHGHGDLALDGDPVADGGGRVEAPRQRDRTDAGGQRSVTAMPSWRTTRPGTSAGASEPATLRGPAASTTSASRADQRSFQP